MSSLRLRIVLAAGLLAVAAVGAVAVAARRGTYVEFQHLQDVEQREAGRSRDAQARAAAAIDGRCCDAGSLTAARAALGADNAFLVVDARGGVRAAEGFGLDATDLHVSIHDDELS